jgi:predicted DNA-binding transcriptional regulator AlpA
MSEFLSLDDITDLVHLKRETVRDKLVKRSDFPRPAFSLSQKTRRWKLEDVRAWLLKQQAENAR